MNLRDKKILVTGGNSFLGKELIPLLKKKGANVITFSSKDYDLREEEKVKELFKKFNPNGVIHLAVDCGGTEYMKKNPGSILYNNLMMNSLVQEYSRLNGIEKFVGIGSVASYPKNSKSPLKEERLWEGYPEEIQASYGLAKKMMLVQSQVYREQYNFNAIHLIPTNLYGPNCLLDPKNIRVIPSLIKKMTEAKGEIIMTGDKNSTRDFLYVKDCAEAIIMATESYDKSLPINIGYGKNITIERLVEQIKKITNFKGKIIWEESSKESIRNSLDVKKAEKEFGWKAKTSLEEGLNKTVNWYLKNYKNLK